MIIEEGLHKLSGIGSTSYHDDWYNDDIEVELFKIDGIVYGAYIDPNDGYRSYSRITDVPWCKCQYEFEPQDIIVEEVSEYSEEDGWVTADVRGLIIKDAISGKVVLEVSTDYSDDYYPRAIFNYCPENLWINRNK